MEIRRLDERDRPAVETFLLAHRDSAMFLRENLCMRGLTYTGQPHGALYMAAVEAGRVVALLAHAWNGVVLILAPVEADALARALAAASGRRVTGLSGPHAQVMRVRAALGLQDAPAQLDAVEDLYGLELAALRMPDSSPRLRFRAATEADRETLIGFRRAYEIETLGASPEDATRNAARLHIANTWVALLDGRIVSQSGFNAALDDIVQLGGIYTPPEERNRGYARAAIAAHLVAARAAGVTRAVLFTLDPAAARCYRALGFERVGDYAIVLLK
jgi:predicted GNAT family acetyltransferase